ncbi:unnamed protein product [Dracunculus medinensis]|uniref:Transketolase-like pyrimidine-binding domain-containing protein n=1 Tax=Dracunculus medinensis TaxID=318479 RepID=A0A3P7PCW0_DRAME|nr:unnamed protein product [Dracunculus medinensis]
MSENLSITNKPWFQDWQERKWFATSFEKLIDISFSIRERLHYAKMMLRCQNYDHFLALKFPQVKRYGCEGAESMFIFFIELFNLCPSFDIEDVTVCMAHRGRLNLLCELMQFPIVQMFRKMQGKTEFPDNVHAVGDVLSHLKSSFDQTTSGGMVHVTMIPNPSHLEAVNPVAVGRTRGRCLTKRRGDYGPCSDRDGDSVLCVQIHGDGAFSGQGICWETIGLSQLPHFRIGGSVHLVVNNQIAYTAEAQVTRSSDHCTDIAKAFDSPVIYVNGDYPELVAKATRLAMGYRNQYRKDIFINLLCYRRWGHNELDDPRFTQPVMYKIINERTSPPDRYAAQLIEEEIMTTAEKDSLIKGHMDSLMDDFRATNKSSVGRVDGNWNSMVEAPNAVEKWDTGVNIDLLRFIGAKSINLNSSFAINEHLQKMHVDARLKKMEMGTNIDWSTAEALAFGSILLQGYDIRLSGQDVGRGTFSQRHLMLIDQETNETIVPLNHMYSEQQNFIEVANNMLSEEAILGFEFGFSMENPMRLCLWEAQFGDFSNGAQIIIDTFITSAEHKWLTKSGLVLVLPHGFDGAGPEHSSARIERFLQLCDSREDQIPPDGESVNIHIVNPTTSAQYFHLLRRQIITPYRKPLIIIGPKILLRHPMVVFVSGKHYFTLQKERDKRKVHDMAIVRVESLCPFPFQELQEAVAKYPNAKKFVWSQEEPRNAGAWSYIRSRFSNAFSIALTYCGRPELAWTATAIASIHQHEHKKVLADTFSA